MVGEQKERKKHWSRMEKFLSDITLPVCYPGIFMKVMLALPSLTFWPHSWTQSEHDLPALQSLKVRIQIRMDCLVYFAPFTFEGSEILQQGEFLSGFPIWLITPAAVIVPVPPALVACPVLCPRPCSAFYPNWWRWGWGAVLDKSIPNCFVLIAWNQGGKL